MALHGKGTAVLFGKHNLSGFLNSVDVSDGTDLPETTVFSNSSRTHAAGLDEASISASGLFDGDEGAIDEAMQAALRNDTGTPMSIVFAGADTIGNRGRVAKCKQANYSTPSEFGGLVTVEAELQVDGPLCGAVLLAPLVGRTASGNGASHDAGAATALGAIANLHVTSAAGTAPSLEVKVQHSVDGSTWVDLITFASLAAAGSEQKTASGDVYRYRRAIWTVTGADADFTFAVVFSAE